MASERKNIVEFDVFIEGTVARKSKARDSMVYVHDTLDAAEVICHSIFKSTDPVLVLQVYDRIREVLPIGDVMPRD